MIYKHLLILTTTLSLSQSAFSLPPMEKEEVVSEIPRFQSLTSPLKEKDKSHGSNCLGLDQIIQDFSEGKGEPFCKNVEFLQGGNDKSYFGIHQHKQQEVDFKDLKEKLFKKMGIKGTKLVQIVGDSNQFSEKGTSIAKAFLTPYLEEADMVEYGFTGYLTSDRRELDINSLVNDWLEANPNQAPKVLASTVGHSVTALTQWGCKVSDKVRNFVVVYNDHGTGQGHTKFGDDIIASDYLLEDNDKLIMLEGGAQSFAQATNILARGGRVDVHTNLRKPVNQEFFSASEFFSLVKAELKKNISLSAESVGNILDAYLKTHKAWNTDKPDAPTKEALFFTTVKKFIDEGIYYKLLTHTDFY